MSTQHPKDQRAADHTSSALQSKPSEPSIDRRSEPRVTVDVHVDCRHEDTFLFAYITDVSTLGIFIRANHPHPPGTLLKVCFLLPGEQEALTLDGTVIWINPYDPTTEDRLQAGMGIRFDHLDEATRKQIATFVSRQQQDPVID